MAQVFFVGESLESILDQCRAHPLLFEPFKSASFKFNIEAANRTIELKAQIDLINRFSFLPLEGPVDLEAPQVTFSYFEEYDTGKNLKGCFFGVSVGKGARGDIQKFNLKKREYLGTTSMDPELSLLMANMALVKPGSLILDPFVGTGSFLVTSSHFGAYSMGADINGLELRGKSAATTANNGQGQKGKPVAVAPRRSAHKREVTKIEENSSKSVKDNIRQYGLEKRVVDGIVCDLAHHPWRIGAEFWDAIICDPPYGIRAGAKKIGLASEGKSTTANGNPVKLNGEIKYPETVPYEMNQVIVDLIAFAASFLVPGGRLVYWLPTITDEYEPADIPAHPRMRIVANSEQCFGKWSRRLVTMQKLAREEPDVPIGPQGQGRIPAHSRFRNKYFEILQ